ncbi:hypothetical protein NQ317_015302 [Molorchus minor]|uniref:Translation initiation factor beta propellor-like domain-containing protein n=1 Tax=Molorchus minor TaxID=1323400 RepID=A0ABQ9JS26_9CUCU|nr:hypothetical protein NQ317_015302 [Molorchus minor]
MFFASASTTVKFHEYPSGNVVHNYQPGTKVEGPIRSISWSRDGQWLALVPYSGITEIVSVKNQLKLLNTIQDFEEPSCAAFQNTTRKHIALGTKNGQVVIYDIKTRNTKKRFPRTSSFITHVGFTAKDTHCVASCRNGDILLYSNVTNNLSCTFKVPKSNSVTCLRTNPQKRNLIIAGSNEGIISLWDSNTNKVKFCIEAHKAPVTSVAFSPVNSDLIISTGSDRQFSVYDIIDNKCIASISVENNITAVDFSPDGKYFAMGSQNGFVYIYDSRNIQEPIHSFQAHKSAVKHLAFQSQADVSNSSSISDPTDFPSNEIIESIHTSNSVEAGDSFIAALGLDKNNTADSMGPEESIKSPEVNKWTVLTDTPSGHNSTKILHEKIGLGDSRKQFSSTPKTSNSQNLIPSASPIVNVNQKSITVNATMSDIQAAAKEAVKEELRSTVEELKSDIKFQSMHSTYQMKRMLLDLQMAMVKEFIKVENFCNGIKDEITIDSRSDGNSSLLEENEQLKRRIEELEQQIASLTQDHILQNGENGV